VVLITTRFGWYVRSVAFFEAEMPVIRFFASVFFEEYGLCGVGCWMKNLAVKSLSFEYGVTESVRKNLGTA